MTILRTTFASFITGMFGAAILLTALLFTRPREVKIVLPPTVHHSTRVIDQTDEMIILMSGDYLLGATVDGLICYGNMVTDHSAPCHVAVPMPKQELL